MNQRNILIPLPGDNHKTIEANSIQIKSLHQVLRESMTEALGFSHNFR